MNIPRTMSTQHPDNVRQPFFVDNSTIGGDEEIKEAFYAFSHLKIREQLWDCEGKEVDNFVVEKLLSRYEDYFRKRKLGRDVFITLRGPNPKVEKSQGKILLETLESIPRNFDIAKHFYGEGIAPIFEIAIPMTGSSAEILRVKDYYSNHIIGRSEKLCHDLSVKDWVGDFNPKEIKVIPLIEDKDSMLSSHLILKDYLEKAPQDYQRVWLARSDPALNYGSLAAILLNKISLLGLQDVEEELSIPLYPIIGCGSVPFRGNFRPDNLSNCINAYPSVQTYTMQSAFKYDYPEENVREAVFEIESSKRKKAFCLDEEDALSVIEKTSAEYQKQVSLIAPLVNQISPYVPERRKRKLHIGLFGYSRESGKVKLPRAIKFCASLYSIGIPPEILGLSALGEKDIEKVHQMSKSFEKDMGDALRYLNKENLKILHRGLVEKVEQVASLFDFTEDERHKKITSLVLEDLKKGDTSSLKENIERAASIRNFLG